MPDSDRISMCPERLRDELVRVSTSAILNDDRLRAAQALATFALADSVLGLSLALRERPRA